MYDIADVIDGRYTLVATIGAGGMGKVLRVVDDDGNEYALKYCEDTDPEQRRRFA
jgi:hypothetical protein